MTRSFAQSSCTRPYPVCSVVAVIAAALFLSSRSGAQPIHSAPEQSIKAAYLYNFAAYVGWPEGILDAPDDSLTIGVFGDDALADELEQITDGRLAHGLRIRIRQVRVGDALDDLHILFVAAEATGVLARFASEAQARSILVVTESGDAPASGSVINFRLVEQRVRFDVSLDAAHKSRLTISSRLLAVAEQVHPRTDG